MGGKEENGECLLSGETTYTMESEHPRAEAMVIWNGRITYLGDATGAKRLREPHTTIIDLQNHIALPGFNGE